MPSAVSRLAGQGRVTPPSWLEKNLMLEVYMGSRAYGCHDPDSSDYDIYGICIPPKGHIFPNTLGLIPGFDDCPKFKDWSEHHVKDTDGKREYDFTIYSIVRFFELAAQNNPNMVDAMFVPETCIKHITPIGTMIRDSRHLFLSKMCWKRFRGYASEQFHKLERKPIGKRADLITKFGYDVKFAYHCFRLLNEAEQILTEGDLDLTRGNGEYKAIRRGEWSLERLQNEFVARKLALEGVYHASALPEKPDHDSLRTLLLSCLEHHYGSLSRVVESPDIHRKTLVAIDALLEGVRAKL